MLSWAIDLYIYEGRESLTVLSVVDIYDLTLGLT